MKILKNCSKCKKKDTLESIHYYDKNKIWKTDPIAFLICKNCFQLYRLQRLPFINDIQLLSIHLGANQDTKSFDKIELKKDPVYCLYCGNSEADFSYTHVDSEGISYQRTEKKPCVVKLHTKDKKKKSDRKQVGYLCGFCRRVYFDNKKMKLPFNKQWAEFIQKLPSSHPKFSIEQEKKLNELYKRRENTKKELELKSHNPKERNKIKLKIDELEKQIRSTNHVILYSLGGGYHTREIGL